MKSTQATRYVRMCIKGFTSYHQAMMNGCGNSPWKRWAEWEADQMWFMTDDIPSPVCWIGKHVYYEQTRTRQVLTMDGKKAIIKERRLVRVK